MVARQVGEEKLQFPGRKGSFQESLSAAVDESLMSLGRAAGASIYSRMEKEYGLEKDEIPERLGDFELAIRKTLGPGGPIIETLVLMQLCQKLDVDYDVLQYRGVQAAVAEIEGIFQHNESQRELERPSQ